MEDTVTQVKDALSRVSFRAQTKDPEGAVISFFVSVVKELRRNRVSTVLDTSPKSIIQCLIPKLEPYTVRETV